MREPAFWYRPPSLMSRLLTPFSAIYGAITARRMARAGEAARLPVICVGNYHLGGAGKIQLNLQNRTVELSAWTDRSEIATGASVLVTRVVGPDSVEVSLANTAAPTVAAN